MMHICEVMQGEIAGKNLNALNQMVGDWVENNISGTRPMGDSKQAKYP